MGKIIPRKKRALSLCWSTLKQPGVQNTLLIEEIPGHIHARLAVNVLASVTKCFTQNAFRSCSLLWHYTSRNHSCLNRAHKGKNKIAYEKRSFGCREFYLLFSDLWSFFGYSLCFTEIKSFTSFRIYRIAISLICHHENIFIFESVRHGGRKTKMISYWYISSKGKNKGHMSLIEWGKDLLTKDVEKKEVLSVISYTKSC